MGSVTCRLTFLMCENADLNIEAFNIFFKLRTCHEFDLREYKPAWNSKLLFENTHTLIERHLKIYFVEKCIIK